MPYEARAISDDGQRVLTRFPTPSHYNNGKTAVWSPAGVQYFPGGAGFSHSAYSEGHRMSRDGRFAAGWAIPDLVHPSLPPQETAWIWNTLVGSVRFLKADWDGASRALDVSDDGRVAVGFATHTRESFLQKRLPALWTDGEFEVLGQGSGQAVGVSADGTFVTGEQGGRPFLWDRARGMRMLETLPPIDWPFWWHGFRGRQVSDDGDTVLIRQYQFSYQGEFELAPHLWRDGAGAVDAGELLRAFGAELPEDVLGFGLAYLGDDGRTLVGSAYSTLAIDQPYLLVRAVLPPAAETYCTAPTGASGCTPSLGFAGTPSARTGAGFTIHARSVPAGSFGVLAYGTSGPASVPFGGGVLCVAEPTTCVALGSAEGAHACDGRLAVDFNAVVAQAQDPALIGGAHVWAQMWIRDGAAAPPHLLLSDALVFTLWP